MCTPADRIELRVQKRVCAHFLCTCNRTQGPYPVWFCEVLRLSNLCKLKLCHIERLPRSHARGGGVRGGWGEGGGVRVWVWLCNLGSGVARFRGSGSYRACGRAHVLEGPVASRNCNPKKPSS